MPSNTVKYFSCIYYGAGFIAVEPYDRHTKANKHKINRDDIETLHTCNECGKNNKLYWSEQKKPI